MFLGICCSAFATSDLIPALMEQGIKYYSEKKYDAASDYLGQVVDMEPEHSQARYYLTYCLALSGNNEQALKHAEILAKKFPNEAQYKTLVNQIKKQMGVKAAKKKKNTSGNIKNEVIIGGYKSSNNNYEVRGPKVDYTPRQMKPSKPLTELEKAIRKMDEEEYDTAESMFKEILKKEPKNSEVVHNLGVIEIARNNYEEAVKHFINATKMNPKNFQSYFLLADCYMNLGEYKKAEAALNNANSIKSDEFALLKLAGVELELGDLKKAENIYNQILSKNPNFYDASVGLAKIRLEKGKVDEAMTLVNEALSNGNRGEANYVKASILILYKMEQEALDELSVALSESPNNTKYLLAKGIANIRLYNYNAAIEAASLVLGINPNSVPAKLIMAEAYIRGSVEDEAEKVLDEIENKKLGYSGEVHKLRGLLSKRRGDEEDAKKQYEIYYSTDGSKPTVQLEYAEFLESIENEKDYAIDLYKKIAKNFPDTFFATKAKEAIAKLTAKPAESNDNIDEFGDMGSLDDDSSYDNIPAGEGTF